MNDDMMDSLNDAMSGSQGSNVQSGSGDRQLDLVFIIDCTGSMGSYIASATKNIEVIVTNILQSEKLSSPESLRIGLVSYRDHPPQDNSYITKNFDFTSDVSKMKESLKTLYASGGGDGPEAVTAAMRASLDLQWRPVASKMTVIIADAPPHGLGEYGDGFPAGSPDGEDPLVLARQMASQGITLFVVACEPALSGYQFATDFFRAITSISSGLMVPLTTAALLSHVIVGSALEQMDMERLIEEVGGAVGRRVHEGLETVDDVARELHSKLLLRNESTKQLVVESIHKDSAEARHNVEVFTSAPSLADAKPLLKKVIGSRFTEKYLASRYAGSRAGTYPAVPFRPAAPAPAAPSSPPRKVLSEFKPFAAATESMEATPLGAATPGDDVDMLTQSVELRFQSISLEQAKRITMASAWRSAPPRG